METCRPCDPRGSGGPGGPGGQGGSACGPVVRLLKVGVPAVLVASLLLLGTRLLVGALDHFGTLRSF